MKTLITAGVIALAASQAQAEGFYQDVVSNNRAASVEIRVNAPSDFVSPLYQVVSGERAETTGMPTVAGTKSSYTPLYRAVTGNPQSRKQDS